MVRQKTDIPASSSPLFSSLKHLVTHFANKDLIVSLWNKVVAQGAETTTKHVISKKWSVTIYIFFFLSPLCRLLSTPRVVWQHNGVLQPILVHLVPWEGCNNPLKICVCTVYTLRQQDYCFYSFRTNLCFWGAWIPKDQLVSAQAQMNIEKSKRQGNNIPKISTSQMTWYNMMGTWWSRTTWQDRPEN